VSAVGEEHIRGNDGDTLPRDLAFVREERHEARECGIGFRFIARIMAVGTEFPAGNPRMYLRRGPGVAIEAREPHVLDVNLVIEGDRLGYGWLPPGQAEYGRDQYGRDDQENQGR